MADLVEFIANKSGKFSYMIIESFHGRTQR